MKTYEVWIDGLWERTVELVKAESSFAARKIYAAKHERKVEECAARRTEAQ